MKSLRPILALFVLPVVLLAVAPATHAMLLYDRDAVLRGELWRLWTGHWVHFSTSHLAWNLIVLVIAGIWLEQQRPGRLLSYTLLAAPCISAGFLLFAPAMEQYGGLSGLATGVVTLLALSRLDRSRPDRAWWLSVLGLVVVKIVFDATQTSPVFSNFASPLIRPSALAHAGGAGLALIISISHQLFWKLPLDSRSLIVPAVPDKLAL